MNLVLLMLLQADAPPLTKMVGESGRVVVMADSPSERVTPPRLVAPGPPPAFSFRLLEGKARHRYGDLDLVLDDAGH